jgi:hypothetical protein
MPQEKIQLTRKTSGVFQLSPVSGFLRAEGWLKAAPASPEIHQHDDIAQILCPGKRLRESFIPAVTQLQLSGRTIQNRATLEPATSRFPISSRPLN